MPCDAEAHLRFPPPCAGSLLPRLAHHHHNGLATTTGHLHRILVQAAICLTIFSFAEKVLNSKTIRSNSSGLSVGCGKNIFFTHRYGICVFDWEIGLHLPITMSQMHCLCMWCCMGVCIYRTGPGSIYIHSGSGYRAWFGDGVSRQGSWGYNGG